MAHTPGEWEVCDEGGSIYGVKPVGIDTRICHCYDYVGGANSLDGLPNARLIAAAPDLLEACKAAVRHVGDNQDVHPAIRDLLKHVIAKAEGG